MAERLATINTLIASTLPVRDFGTPRDDPDSAARAAETASRGSDLPARRRSCRLGAVNLDHIEIGARQMAGEPSPIGPGSLHTNAHYRAERSHPTHQPGVPSVGRGERLHAQHAADLVDNSGDVNVLVGVDTSGDRALLLYDGHRHPFARNGQGVSRTCRERDQRTPELLAQPPTSPTRPVSPVPELAGESFEGQLSMSVSRFESQANSGTQLNIETTPLVAADPTFSAHSHSLCRLCTQADRVMVRVPRDYGRSCQPIGASCCRRLWATRHGPSGCVVASFGGSRTALNWMLERTAGLRLHSLGDPSSEPNEIAPDPVGTPRALRLESRWRLTWMW